MFKLSLVSKKFFEYLTPTLLMSVALSSLSIVNAMIVGNLLGKTALAAMNLNAPLIYFSNALVLVFSFGGTVLIAQEKGKMDKLKANRIFSNVMFFGLLCAIFFSVLLLTFSAQFAHFLVGDKLALYDMTLLYFKPIALMLPFLFISTYTASILRTDGMPKYSAAMMVLMGIASLATSFILIKYFAFSLDGAAWGIFAGFALGVLLIIPYFFTKRRTLHFVKPTEIINILNATFKTGLPNFLTNILNVPKIFILNHIVLMNFNVSGVAIFAVCLNAFYFAYFFMGGISNTLLVLTGILFGEHDITGLKKLLKAVFTTVIIVSLAFVFIYSFEPSFIAKIFGLKDSNDLIMFDKAMRIYSLCIPIYSINYLFRCYYQCTKHENMSTIITVLDEFVVIIGCVIFFTSINPNLLWWAFVASEFIVLMYTLIQSKIVAKKQDSIAPFLINEAKNTVRFDLTNMDGFLTKTEIFAKNNGVDILRITKIINELMKIPDNIHSDICIKICEKNDKNVSVRIRDNNIYKSDDFSTWNYSKNIGFNIYIKEF